jgi:hypothetical protein
VVDVFVLTWLETKYSPTPAIAITKITQRPSAARTIQSQVRFDGAIEVS